MQALELNWMRWLLATTAIGLALAGFLYLGFYLPNRATRALERDYPRERFPAGIEVSSRPMPPVLIWFYVVLGASLLAYTIYSWLARTNY